MSAPELRPPRPGWDTAISIAALVFTLMLGGIGVLVGIFSLAFLDHCPPETCSADGAVTSVATSLLAMGVVGTAGVVLTIVRLARRRPAWPFAVGTLALCMVVGVMGAAGYAISVGA